MPFHRRAIPVEALGRVLADIPHLEELLKSHAKALNVGMGLLREGHQVSGFWPISFSVFCNLVRRTPAGQKACEESDAKAGRACSNCPVRETKHDFDLFRCHMGLVDLPSPIFIRDRFLCHAFMGQIRDKAINEETQRFLRKRYKDLSLSDEGIEFSELLSAYRRLKRRTALEIRQMDRVLRALANAIGIIAEHFQSLQSINDLSLDLSPIAGTETGLRIIYDTIAGLLEVDSGSIWLTRREVNAPAAFGYATVLRPIVLQWFEKAEDESLKESLVIPYGKGLGGLVAKRRKPATRRTVSEISNIPPAYGALRQRRGLESITLSPIMSEGNLMGIIELGSKKKEYFTTGNEQLVETVAAIAGNFIKRTKERGLVLEMHRIRSEIALFNYLEQELPLLFGSLAATVYLPQERAGKTVLAPAFPDVIVRGVGPAAQQPGWTPIYDVENAEGLTGWVGKYMCRVRLKDCANTKEIQQSYDCGRFRMPNGEIPPCPPAWNGKTRARTEVRTRRTTYPVLICPSVNEANQLLAVLRICEREFGPFSQADEDFAGDVCKQLAICLANLRWQREESLRIAREEMGLTIGRYTHVFNRAILEVERHAADALALAQQSPLGSIAVL